MPRNTDHAKAMLGISASTLLDDVIREEYIDWDLLDERRLMLSSTEQTLVDLARMIAAGRFDRFDRYTGAAVLDVLETHLERS